MDASCKIQRSIHDVRLTYKYVSRILGTYQTYEAIKKRMERIRTEIREEILECLEMNCRGGE